MKLNANIIITIKKLFLLLIAVISLLNIVFSSTILTSLSNTTASLLDSGNNIGYAFSFLLLVLLFTVLYRHGVRFFFQSNDKFGKSNNKNTSIVSIILALFTTIGLLSPEILGDGVVNPLVFYALTLLITFVLIVLTFGIYAALSAITTSKNINGSLKLILIPGLIPLFLYVVSKFITFVKEVPSLYQGMFNSLFSSTEAISVLLGICVIIFIIILLFSFFLNGDLMDAFSLGGDDEAISKRLKEQKKKKEEEQNLTDNLQHLKNAFHEMRNTFDEKHNSLNELTQLEPIFSQFQREDRDNVRPQGTIRRS